MNLGSATPTLAAVGSPHVDARGLWVDMRAEYTGNFTMSLETKLDLMKLKRGAGLSSHSPTLSSSNPPSPAEPVPTSQAQSKAYRRSVSSERLLRHNVPFDTDTDDSVESSSEEDWDDDALGGELGASLPTGGAGPTSRKLLRIVDSVAASRYFQQVIIYYYY